MSTLAEIETAIAQLPPEQWEEIRRWMDRAAPTPRCAQPTTAGLVDWTNSAAATRRREPQTCVPAAVVADALAAVRA